MTRGEAKKLLPIIQAYAEGKTIQLKRFDDTWVDQGEGLDFVLEVSDYRIKPESEYRPYKDCHEMIADFKERSNTTTMPVIWIKHKVTKNVFMVTGFEFNEETSSLLGIKANDMFFDFEELFNNFTYLDDMPCGVKE